MAMQKVTLDGRTLWLGEHPTIGLVIYDELEQRGISEVWVRLYKTETSSMGLFIRSKIRDQLKKPDAPAMNEAHTPTAQYIKAKEKVEAMRRDNRRAHCYSCSNEINTLNFSVCTTCHWIVCDCGACGCGYSR